MSTTPPPVVHPGIENKTLFRYTLWARDDERVLYAADDLKHIRYFCSWLADDLYLTLCYGAAHEKKITGSREVPDGWQWGEYVEPDYDDLIAEAEAEAIQDQAVCRDLGEIVPRDYSKAAALAFERDLLTAQRRRARRNGF